LIQANTGAVIPPAGMASLPSKLLVYLLVMRAQNMQGYPIIPGFPFTRKME
jgi:hypothetical protein